MIDLKTPSVIYFKGIRLNKFSAFFSRTLQCHLSVFIRQSQAIKAFKLNLKKGLKQIFRELNLLYHLKTSLNY